MQSAQRELDQTTPLLSQSQITLNVAMDAVESESASTSEKIEMLLAIATDLQQKPKTSQQLKEAISLYDKTIELSQETYPLFKARSLAGKGTALRTIPSEDPELLLSAQQAYELALPILQELASPKEVAEVEMNLGLVLQALVPFHRAKIQDAVQLYQRALKIFNGLTSPQEYAILQNNIAIAYLSFSSAPEKKEMYQALAVQNLQEGLEWISLQNNPREYAMLQNNLANALQYLPSTHPLENNLKALEAYDEALKVRTLEATPLEYASTIANKANLLYNLPDDLDHPEQGNRQNLQQAQTYYQEALQIFSQYGEFTRGEVVATALAELEQELAAWQEV